MVRPAHFVWRPDGLRQPTVGLTTSELGVPRLGCGMALSRIHAPAYPLACTSNVATDRFASTSFRPRQISAVPWRLAREWLRQVLGARGMQENDSRRPDTRYPTRSCVMITAGCPS